MKKIIFNLIVIILTAVIMFALVFFTSGIEELSHFLARIKYRWIAAAFGCMVVYWLTGGLILHIITQMMFEKQRLRDSFKLNMIGHFFNSVTPFSTGGQPVQAYVMIKDGIKAGHAASILVIRSMLYSTVLFFYTLLVFIFKAQFYGQRIPHFFLLCIIGFAANIFIIAMYALFLYNKNTAHKLISFTFGILRKLKFIKNLDAAYKKFDAELASFSEGAAVLRKNKLLLYDVVLLQVIQFTIFFLVPYFIYLGAGEATRVNLWDMIASQPIITMITSYIPTPGSTGGIEGAGYLFFSLFFKPGTIIPVILIWRIITYYSNVIFGGLFAVLAPEKPLETS